MIPRLGAPVMFLHGNRLRRSYRSMSPHPRKEWQRVKHDGGDAVQGILVGVRTLSDGINVYYGHDEPIEYRPDKHFTVYVIAYDLRRVPVLVLPQDVHLIEESHMTETPTREELIALCEAAVVPQEHWYNRDSSAAQRQVGEALVLLRAGCDFALATDPPQTQFAWWVEITHRGFMDFELGRPATARDLFYIPTRASLDQAAGKDWY